MYSIGFVECPLRKHNQYTVLFPFIVRSLALWTTQKKRPHFSVKAAHGYQKNGQPNWLTAVAALINTDLVATGGELWNPCVSYHSSFIRDILWVLEDIDLIQWPPLPSAHNYFTAYNFFQVPWMGGCSSGMSSLRAIIPSNDSSLSQ